MEEDSRSDSGVSTLRSDGARSSGDERSGSRSSAISDERSGSRPSAQNSADPDIKIVGTVTSQSSYYRHSRGPETSESYNPRGQHPPGHQRDRAMADPRHAPGMSSLSGAQLSALAAAAHYGPQHGALPSHLHSQASAAALLQYQQLATAAALGTIRQLNSKYMSGKQDFKFFQVTQQRLYTLQYIANIQIILSIFWIFQPGSQRTRCWSRVTAPAWARVCPPTSSPRARPIPLPSCSWSGRDRSLRSETEPSGRTLPFTSLSSLIIISPSWSVSQVSRVIENLSKCFCKIVRAFERNQLRLQNNWKPLKDYFVNIDNFSNKCCIKIALLFWITFSRRITQKIFCLIANDPAR